MQRDIAGIIDIFEIVIHHIKLGTVNHLDTLGFGFFLSIRIALNDAVIGDGDGFVAHRLRYFNIFLNFADTIHVRHFGVEMKFDALFFFWVFAKRARRQDGQAMSRNI